MASPLVITISIVTRYDDIVDAELIIGDDIFKISRLPKISVLKKISEILSIEFYSCDYYKHKIDLVDAIPEYDFVNYNFIVEKCKLKRII